MTTERFPSDRTLAGKTILITGSGGGIGLETAKALAERGAAIIIAEIDQEKGRQAAACLHAHCPACRAEHYAIDLADAQQIVAMHRYLTDTYGFIDVLIHNACTISIGAVETVPLETWDTSYRVNFRAPLLLTQLFLPAMKAANKGTIVFVSSSGAAPYMGAYEVFKTAQVELCNTLAGELEGTDIYTYTVGPGLVKTATAMRSIELVAGQMGMTVDQFYAMNESHILDVADAGLGIALSVLHADRYNGQEIGSIQALIDCGPSAADQPSTARPADLQAILPSVQQIMTIFQEQYAGWLERNIFERQWVLRDFKKTVGMSAEQFHMDMNRLGDSLAAGSTTDIPAYKDHFGKLKSYFERQLKLLQGFEKDPAKLQEHTACLTEWIRTLSHILEQL